MLPSLQLRHRRRQGQQRSLSWTALCQRALLGNNVLRVLLASYAFVANCLKFMPETVAALAALPAHPHLHKCLQLLWVPHHVDAQRVDVIALQGATCKQHMLLCSA